MRAFEVNHRTYSIVAATSPSAAMHHTTQTSNPKSWRQNQAEYMLDQSGAAAGLGVHSVDGRSTWINHELRAITFGNLRAKKVNVMRTARLSRRVCGQVSMIFDLEAT
jgi:hypothetical protein